MPKLTPISWKKFEKFLIHVGCLFKRQKGSHRIYSREGLARPIIIPQDDELPKFIIRNNLRTLEMNIKEYLEILQKL